MEFDLQFLDTASQQYLQRAIDAIKKANAWDFVKEGRLLTEKNNSISKSIFSEIEQDIHSTWVLKTVTSIAQNYILWRSEFLHQMFLDMKETINTFCQSFIESTRARFNRYYLEAFLLDENERMMYSELQQLKNKRDEMEFLLKHISNTHLVKLLVSISQKPYREVLLYTFHDTHISDIPNKILLEHIDNNLTGY